MEEIEYSPLRPITEEDLEEAKEETQRKGDELSDLFESPKPDDPDMDVSDVVNVDMEEDIMDGDIEDLVEVTDEDVMGEDLFGDEDADFSDLLEVTPGAPASMPDRETEPKRYKLTPRARRIVRPYPLPVSMGSMNEEE